MCMGLKRTSYFKNLCLFIALAVLWCGLGDNLLNSSVAEAKSSVLPQIKAMVGLSEAYSLPFMRGIRFDPSNPLNLEFILDQGSDAKVLHKDKERIVRYFLGALTIPEDKLWVNLSPYESDRIIDENVAQTEIGETLLAQDYLLKQLSSSLTHPDTELGKKYWSSEGAIGQSPSDSLNKIWIVPGEISIYEETNAMVVADATLDIQTEADYIIPEIKKEVNNGRNFAELRQMYYSVVLAQWFKRKFVNSLYSFYFNSQKMNGVNVVDPGQKDAVFKQYVSAFKNGAYNIIRKEHDPLTDRLVKRKYFSGGADISSAMQNTKGVSSEIAAALIGQKEHISLLTKISFTSSSIMSASKAIEKLNEVVLFLNPSMNPKTISEYILVFKNLIELIVGIFEDMQSNGVLLSDNEGAILDLFNEYSFEIEEFKGYIDRVNEDKFNIDNDKLKKYIMKSMDIATEIISYLQVENNILSVTVKSQRSTRTSRPPAVPKYAVLKSFLEKLESNDVTKQDLAEVAAGLRKRKDIVITVEQKRGFDMIDKFVASDASAKDRINRYSSFLIIKIIRPALSSSSVSLIQSSRKKEVDRFIRIANDNKIAIKKNREMEESQIKEAINVYSDALGDKIAQLEDTYENSIGNDVSTLKKDIDQMLAFLYEFVEEVISFKHTGSSEAVLSAAGSEYSKHTVNIKNLEGKSSVSSSLERINGGINLKGMFNDVELSASSSVVSVASEQAEKINGVTFQFIKETKTRLFNPQPTGLSF